MRPGDFFDFTPLDRGRLRTATALDLGVGVVCAAVLAGWLAGRPLFYTAVAPVMSPFTALSLLIMVIVRQARLHLETWPMVLSLAMSGLVLGGNLSSMLMLSTMPAELWSSFPTCSLLEMVTVTIKQLFRSCLSTSLEGVNSQQTMHVHVQFIQ